MSAVPARPYYSDQRPPSGVPRWLWPPPGAIVRKVVIEERMEEDGRTVFAVTSGNPPDRLHLRALQWLLVDHSRGHAPWEPPFHTEVVLEIADTDLPNGRRGHAYALNGGPIGEPRAEAARGVLWRYVHSHVSPVE
jgi:hypothetical protein